MSFKPLPWKNKDDVLTELKTRIYERHSHTTNRPMEEYFGPNLLVLLDIMAESIWQNHLMVKEMMERVK